MKSIALLFTSLIGYEIIFYRYNPMKSEKGSYYDT